MTAKSLAVAMIVKDEAGRKLYFRFYDPCVLRVFLPTGSSQQLLQMFGPIQQFIVDDHDLTKALLFSLGDGVLRKDVVDLTREEINLTLHQQRNIEAADTEEVIV